MRNRYFLVRNRIFSVQKLGLIPRYFTSKVCFLSVLHCNAQKEVYCSGKNASECNHDCLKQSSKTFCSGFRLKLS